jgi:DNA-3-methyladenine glycosylase II
MPTRTELAKTAVSHLRRRDVVLKDVIRQVGAYELRTDKNRFKMLAFSIISQQLSTKVARTLRDRLVALTEKDLLPSHVAALSHEQLRGIGLSRNKALFLHDLAAAATDGRIRLERIGRKDDEAVIEELIQVKGIGRWTAQMFLMFSLGRPDVLPVGDLGIRVAMRNLYGLPELPSEKEAEALGAPWRPYATFASWYCWRSLDLGKKEKDK